MCRTVRKTLSMVWLIAVVQPQCGNALRHMTDTGVPYYSVSRQQHPPPCHTIIVVRTCVHACVCACVRICVCACVRASLLGHAAAPKKACPASSCKSRRLPLQCCHIVFWVRVLQMCMTCCTTSWRMSMPEAICLNAAECSTWLSGGCGVCCR